MSTLATDPKILPIGNRVIREFRRGFDRALAGAMGGIFGLYFYVELIHTENLAARDALAGALIGGSIGFFLNAAEPFQESAWRKLCRTASWGAIAGAVGGSVGLLIGEYVVLAMFQGGLIGRALSWSVLGLGIGISQGLAYRSVARLKFGVIGGAIGGFFGGFFFEALRERFGNRYDLGQALGIVLLGGGLGLCLALVESVLGRAWILVMNGRQEGRSYLLAGRKASLGLDERADIGLFGDAAIVRRHAEIQSDTAGSTITPFDGLGRTKINGQVILGPSPLNNGDRIELGSTVLVYQRR